jgi:hypothetical protein
MCHAVYARQLMGCTLGRTNLQYQVNAIIVGHGGGFLSLRSRSFTAGGQLGIMTARRATERRASAMPCSATNGGAVGTGIRYLARLVREARAVFGN